MTSVGSGSTRLVVLRGDSGSGKTTTALALRPGLGERTALIHQDVIRRELLSGPKRERARDAAVLIDGLARQSLDLGYDVILDGIFNLRDYAGLFERLHRDHRGRSVWFQWDVGFDETVRRHDSRPLREAFGVESLREWHDGWQPLPFVDEHRVTADDSVDDVVERILSALGG